MGDDAAWADAGRGSDPPVVPGIDLSRPSIARTYDYLIGGKNNYSVDREVGDHLKRNMPGAVVMARNNRRVLIRAVRALARDAGLRQFLDLGSGLPAADNVHEVAQRYAPGARVVYVDNDPVVLAHGRALLEDNPHTVVVRADLREPAAIRDDPVVRGLIDFGRPVAVVMCGILHHLEDDEDPAGVVRFWRDAVPAGSHFFISHFRTEHTPEAREVEAVLRRAFGRGRWRTDAEIAALFDGLELLPPGIVPTPQWRPDPGAPTDVTLWERQLVAGLAVKR
jgi:hypothetical protein